MVVRVNCRTCGAGLKTKDSNVGKRMRCPRCGTVNALAAVVGAGKLPAPSDTGPLSPRRVVQGLPPLTTLLIAAFVLLGVSAWFQIALRERDQTIRELREHNLDQSRRLNTVQRDSEALAEQVEELQAGPEARYEHAAALLRDARYRESEQAFEAVIALHPTHELALQARHELERVRRLLMDRNLTELGLTVGEPLTGWVDEGGQLGLASPQIELRLRNMGVRTLEGLHLRADFVATRGLEQEVLGDGLVAVPGALSPGVATQVRVRSLGGLQTWAPDAEGRAELPEVSAHVYVKEPGRSFRKVGVYAVAPELLAGGR